MLTGTADLATLAGSAPTMTSLDSEPVTFENVEVLQAAFEMDYRSREITLPPGLHPTTPPVMVIVAWAVPESAWGPFTLAQVRVACRSGVRPRGFVAGSLVSSEGAAAALADRWGFPAQPAPIQLTRFYDSVVLEAGGAIHLTGLDPDPLNAGDVQYTVTTTLAHTPRGLRLVQVEPEYDLRRVERVRPRLDHFDASLWGAGDLAPRYPVSATVGVGTVTIPKLRFVSKPDVLAFEGTESI